MPILLSALAFAQPEPEPARPGDAAAEDAALVVAVEDYAAWPDVPHAVADARLFQDWLVHTRGIPEDRVDLLTSGATQADLDHRLRRAIGRVGPGGTLWVYFAGHGALARDGQDWLILGEDVPTDPTRVDSHGVSLAAAQRWITARGRPALIVLDAGFAREGRDGAPLPVHAVPTALPEPAPGVAVWIASAPGQRNRTLGAHGAFTHGVVGALSGWADSDADGWITAAEADGWVREALVGAQGPSLVVGDASAWPGLPAHRPGTAPAAWAPEPHALAAAPERPGPSDWVARGSGAYRVEGRRVLRGVGVGRDQRFLMDARKLGRASATQALRATLDRFVGELVLARQASGGDPGALAEIAGIAHDFERYRGRLLLEVDGEHTAWAGRPDDAYWAMAELDLEDLRQFVARFADLAPEVRDWALAHLDPIFDGLVTPR